MKLYDSFQPAACAAALGEASGHCLIPRLAWPFHARPLFVIEALTDACVLCAFEGVGASDNACWIPLVDGGRGRTPPEQAWMSAYGQNASANMAQVVASARDGLFAAACFMHCGFTLTQPKVDGAMVIDALASWVKTYEPGAPRPRVAAARDYKWIDSCGGPAGPYWPPCNPTCPFLPSVDRFER